MDMFESVQEVLGKGAAAAKGAVSGLAVERQPFMRGFVRLCGDGWLQGWHERNGGNLSYRMTDDEVQACRPFFEYEGADWTGIGMRAENLRGSCFAVTGAGCFLRNVELEPTRNAGIVQVNDAGDAYRRVWGFEGGCKPTSELASHFMIHSVRVQATDGASRVIYHAHPDDVIALTKVLPLDERVITRALWKALTESVIAFPKGVGVVEWMVPGSAEIAMATGELMKRYDAVIWAQHGVFATGPDFDSTFGLVHTIEKAAKIHCQALMMNGGSGEFANTIDDDGLRAIAREFNLPVNEDFLD